MNTELIHWGWLAVILGLMLVCYTVIVVLWAYIKGVEHGRIEGYGFAHEPTHKEFQGVAYSLGDVIQNGDYEAWRDSLEVEDLL